MTTTAQRLLPLALAIWTATSLSTAFAHSYDKGDLKIHHPWTRATPPGAQSAGGFMTITNTGKEPDRLVGGTLSTAATFEIHESRMEGDIMRMRALDKGLTIAPGETIALKPGSYHVMFMRLNGAFTEGDKIKGTLVFEKAGSVEVDFKVEKPGTASAGQHH